MSDVLLQRRKTTLTLLANKHMIKNHLCVDSGNEEKCINSQKPFLSNYRNGVLSEVY